MFEWIAANGAVMVAIIIASIPSLVLAFANRKKNNADASKSIADATNTLITPLKEEIKELNALIAELREIQFNSVPF